MTLRHLKIFVTVCETGTITSAGKKLFIAQPSISLAISELESHYGLKLFDRISKRIYITESGKHFLQYARHIVSLFEEMEQSVTNLDSTGILRVGTSITIGNYLLPEYAKAFKLSNPQMTLHVTIANSDQIEQSILNNTIDIGLIEGIVHNPYIKNEFLTSDELVLICGPSHPLVDCDEIDLSLLPTQDFILRERGSGGREVFERFFASLDITIQPIWESISTQAIVRAVQADLGLSILPYLLVKDNLDRSEIKQLHIKGVSLKRNCSIIYHKNKFITQTTKDFILICQQTKSDYTYF